MKIINEVILEITKAAIAEMEHNEDATDQAFYNLARTFMNLGAKLAREYPNYPNCYENEDDTQDMFFRQIEAALPAARAAFAEDMLQWSADLAQGAKTWLE